MKHKHHIVFKSHGGLDYALNLKELTDEEHEGDNGPHKNRATDLLYKIDLQNKLQQLFQAEGLYTEEQVAGALGRSAGTERSILAEASPEGPEDIRTDPGRRSGPVPDGRQVILTPVCMAPHAWCGNQ